MFTLYHIPDRTANHPFNKRPPQRGGIDAEGAGDFRPAFPFADHAAGQIKLFGVEFRRTADMPPAPPRSRHARLGAFPQPFPFILAPPPPAAPARPGPSAVFVSKLSVRERKPTPRRSRSRTILTVSSIERPEPVELPDHQNAARVPEPPSA